MLLTSGYLNESTVFYCPSSTNMTSERRGFGSNNLTHWKTAGGFDAETLHYGNWQPRSYGGWQNCVLSNYFYRNFLCGIMNPWHVYQDDTYGIPCTKPRVNVRIGGPMFRTPREQNGRALVADAFSKGTTYDALGRAVAKSGHSDFVARNGSPIEDTRQIAGMGIRGHISTYNVLYGDGHVASFGDPQERVIWHTQGRRDRAFVGGIYTFAFNYFYGSGGWTHMMIDAYGEREENGFFKHTPMAVWHEMDVAADIDVE
jgi:prepilin-type processing-associated H-X9-DG protein